MEGERRRQFSRHRHDRENYHEADLVPLAALISREMKVDRMERLQIRSGFAAQSKKGEDFLFMKEDCQRVAGSTSSTFSSFAIFDGHNGSAAAMFSKENLLSHIMGAIPQGLGRDEWLKSLPRALVAGFVKTDKEFQRRGSLLIFCMSLFIICFWVRIFLLYFCSFVGETSGTTATFVIIDRRIVTVASVGDSRCILDTEDGGVTLLTVDHRLEENAEERQRVTASGGEVGRLSILGGREIGPLRCWPGGLCLSRSIGDMDVGEYIVPVPYVKQVKLPSAGGRLIIASDGVWDALSSETAAKCCRGLPAELAAKLVVKEALRTRGLRDDTTCIVVDIIPPENLSLSPSPQRKKSKLKSLFFGNHSSRKLAKRLAALNMVEELFEEGSAKLAERLGNEAVALQRGSSSCLFVCAICQVNLAPSEGFSVHAGAIFSTSSKPWEGPFLCSTCRDKKDAMEGKRPSGVKVV
ncbi:protein phosphatase 2C family protein isoform X1 [Wolffia australiana]